MDDEVELAVVAAEFVSAAAQIVRDGACLAAEDAGTLHQLLFRDAAYAIVVVAGEYPVAQGMAVLGHLRHEPFDDKVRVGEDGWAYLVCPVEDSVVPHQCRPREGRTATTQPGARVESALGVAAMVQRALQDDRSFPAVAGGDKRLADVALRDVDHCEVDADRECRGVVQVLGRRDGRVYMNDRHIAPGPSGEAARDDALVTETFEFAQHSVNHVAAAGRAEQRLPEQSVVLVGDDDNFPHGPQRYLPQGKVAGYHKRRSNPEMRRGEACPSCGRRSAGHGICWGRRCARHRPWWR